MLGPFIINQSQMSDMAKRWSSIHSHFPKGVFFMHGEMGAGKTTWIASVLRGMGVSESVTSPTFGLIHHYQVGELLALHADLFRLASTEDVLNTGLIDEIENADLAWIEWPDKALIQSDLMFKFRYLNDLERELCVEPCTDFGEFLCTEYQKR